MQISFTCHVHAGVCWFPLVSHMFSSKMFADLEMPLATQCGPQQRDYDMLFPKQTVMTLYRDWVVLHAHGADVLMYIAGLSA